MSKKNNLGDLARTVRGLSCTATAGVNNSEKIWLDSVTEAKLKLSMLTKSNIWLYGPGGVGKSSIAPSLLTDLGKDFYRIQGHSGFEAVDWYGGPQINTDGTISVVYSDIVRAMEEGKPVIVEEFNMISSIHKGPVFSMLDDTPFIDIVMNGVTKRVNKHPDFFVIVTSNDNGTGDMLHLYGGGERENTAILTRFNMVEITYLPERMEKEMIIAKTGFNDDKVLSAMLAIATQTRKLAEDEDENLELAISPRNMLSWASAIKAAQDFKIDINHVDLAAMTVVSRLPASLQETLSTMVVNKFGKDKI